jgi:asparagine synthase (glutamine-hydrolysing)
MCGIAGFVIEGEAPDGEARLAAMADTIRHRGPDGSGYRLCQTQSVRYSIGLAHRRLAIIDLATGDQPMTHREAGVTLVYNGEIYNFAELRGELKAAGHRFRTASDAEVLLNAYIAWGPACVRRLRGMFAFALWDEKRGRLMLARDPFGKKPLYLYRDGQRLVFGSEIKALLAFGHIAARLDHASVSDYLVFRYVPGPHTLFAGIEKLPPGSYALWDESGFAIHKYYSPPYGDSPRNAPAIADPIREFGRVLDDAVRLRMVSDVPYGAFLSGGIDSSAIVALMSRHSGVPVKTFSIGFKEARYSELPYARLVARRFGTDHEEIVVSADDLMQHLPRLIWHSDGPVSEVSNIPIYLMSREAAKTVKMVLSGEGADELLGGYPKHSAERFVALYQNLVPSVMHDGIVAASVGALPYRFRRAKIAVAAMGLRDRAERTARWFGALTYAERDRLLVRPQLRPLDPRPFCASDSRSTLERMLYFDQTSWLPDNLLERGDRMTMAASIEARMPFLDVMLADLMAQLPDRWRIRGFVRKCILRRFMAQTLPREILHRPKVGFRVPVNEWFRGPMRGFVRDHVGAASSLTRALCNMGAIERVLSEHESGRQNHEKLIWPLLNLELFHARFGAR